MRSPFDRTGRREDRERAWIVTDQDRESLARAWFYVPRMMHPGTLVLLEEIVDAEPVLSQLLLVDVETLAQAPKGRRAA